MKKNGVKLIVCVGVLVVLLGAYFGMKYWNEAEAKKEEVTDPSITLCSMSAEDMTKFSYQYNGETYSFVNEDGTWYYEADREFPVDQSLLASHIAYLTQATAEREIEITDESSLAEYGLDAPSNRVSCTDGSGNEVTYLVGAQNDFNSQYYVRIGSENKVYTIASTTASGLSFELYSVVDMEDYPDTSSYELAAIKVEDTSGIRELDTEESSDVYTSAQSLSFVADVDYHCEDLSIYGLDQPLMTITLSYCEVSDTTEDTEQTSETQSAENETESDAEIESAAPEIVMEVTLYVGAQVEDGNYYVRLEGSTEIHTMASTTIQSFLN